jgi:hypothetical protein
MKLFLFFLSITILFGCASTPTNTAISNPSSESFQLLTTTDGRVYRIDTRTGKTSWLDGSTFHEVKEQKMPQLVIGKVYRAEDGKSMYRYEGGGKFIEWSLDKYDITPDNKSKEK